MPQKELASLLHFCEVSTIFFFFRFSRRGMEVEVKGWLYAMTTESFPVEWLKSYLVGEVGTVLCRGSLLSYLNELTEDACQSSINFPLGFYTHIQSSITATTQPPIPTETLSFPSLFSPSQTMSVQLQNPHLPPLFPAIQYSFPNPSPTLSGSERRSQSPQSKTQSA